MPVDSRGKALSIRICTFSRPHMRSFWAATLGFFSAFLGWFAMAPLMTTIKKELKLTKDEVYISNILAVTATVFARILVGPLCDRFGARKPMAFLLIVCALPLGCAALVQDAAGLYVVRTFIGFVGATFVPCQFWTTQMFNGSIVGFANALAGGWGNLGGGVTHGLMVGFLAMFQGFGCTDNQAWRYTLIIPAVIWVLVGLVILFFSDDCPEGHWKNRQQTKVASYSVCTALKAALLEPFTYLLVLSYACGFGVELYVDNAAAAWFEDKFKLDHTAAGLIAALFGLMNIFARALGGWTSDRLARRWFLRGRMLVIFVTIFMCGALLVALGAVQALWAAIFVLVIFSIFCQASCGAVYGLVPFVSAEYSGMVSGFVGAGGNLGAIIWGLIHKQYGASNNESFAFIVVGCVCMSAALLLLVGRLHGATLLPFWGHNGEAAVLEFNRLKQDLCEPDMEAAEDKLCNVTESQNTTLYDPASTDMSATLYEPAEMQPTAEFAEAVSASIAPATTPSQETHVV